MTAEGGRARRTETENHRRKEGKYSTCSGYVLDYLRLRVEETNLERDRLIALSAEKVPFLPPLLFLSVRLGQRCCLHLLLINRGPPPSHPLRPPSIPGRQKQGEIPRKEERRKTEEDGGVPSPSLRSPTTMPSPPFQTGGIRRPWRNARPIRSSVQVCLGESLPLRTAAAEGSSSSSFSYPDQSNLQSAKNKRRLD